MGGNAILNSVRIQKKDYAALCAEILAMLAPFFERLAIPPAAPEKESHGDIDVIVTKPTH